MKIGNRFRLVLLALVTLSGAQGGPLKFQAGAPEDWSKEVGTPLPKPVVSLIDQGQVKPKIEQLWAGDRLIFEAKSIDRRSVSGRDPATAVWAVSAVTGDRPPMYGDGEGSGPDITSRDGKPFLDASPREIWVITPDGTSRRLSKPDMDATHPVISPDGQYVAFTGSQLDANGIPGEEAAYLVSVATGEIVELVHKTDPAAYLVRASDWSPDSRSVTITEMRGEMSSYGTRRTVTVLP